MDWNGHSALAAWYAAVLATLLGLFTIYTRWKDNRVQLSIKSFRRSAGLIEVSWEVLDVRVTNTGKIPTSIHRVVIESEGEVVAEVDKPEVPLPQTLISGAHWTGHAEFDLADLIDSGELSSAIIKVFHENSDTPIIRRFLPTQI